MSARMRLVLSMAVLLGLPASVRAHKLEATCTLRGDKIIVEAFYVEPFFDDPSPADRSKVRVENSAGERIAEGRTDARGLWTFTRPEPGQYTVFVDGGAGHATRKTFSLADGELIPFEDLSAGTVVVPGRDPTALLQGDSFRKQEANRFPFARVALGLGLITLLALMTWWILHERNQRLANQKQPPAPQA